MKFKSPDLDIVISSLNKSVVTNIVIYDLSTVTPFFDYSIVCSANSSRQGHACVEYLRDDAEKNNLTVKGYADNTDSKWFLVDLNNIIVHIFVGDERERFNLDGLYYQLDKKVLED